MATPVSKRIQQDRKSTFLDNISAQAVGEEQRKKEKKNKEKTSEISSGGKGTKRKAGKTTTGAGTTGTAKKVNQSNAYLFSLVPRPVPSLQC